MLCRLHISKLVPFQIFGTGIFSQNFDTYILPSFWPCHIFQEAPFGKFWNAYTKLAYTLHINVSGTCKYQFKSLCTTTWKVIFGTLFICCICIVQSRNQWTTSLPMQYCHYPRAALPFWAYSQQEHKNKNNNVTCRPLDLRV